MAVVYKKLQVNCSCVKAPVLIIPVTTGMAIPKKGMNITLNTRSFSLPGISACLGSFKAVFIGPFSMFGSFVGLP
jgi:hypothetical protein